MSYDLLNRLTSRSADFGGKTRSWGYLYDDLNRRVRGTDETGKYWQWGYDNQDQLTSAQKKFTDATAIPGYSFGYTFDDIGNRTQSTVNGSNSSWTANLLNQYSSRDIPRAYGVWGEVNPSLALDIEIDGISATLVDGQFYGEVSAPDNNAWYDSDSATVTASKSGGDLDEKISYSGKKSTFIPAHPESFTYDADGNLLTDGRWSYTWNAENRLVAMETLPAAVTAGAPNQRLEFAYDSQGRRFEKKVLDWDSQQLSFVLSHSSYFLYDSWNLIAELDGTGDVIRSYVWGLDLAGALSTGSGPSAGGVGGLLSVTDEKTSISFSPWYDGNGNVMGYAGLADGSVVAEYEYSPFGETIRSTGELADLLPFTFSTKFADAESELIYYGFRYYDSGMGRWLSRDPLGEAGGINLYGFIGNDGVNGYDYLGLAIRPFTKPVSSVVWNPFANLSAFAHTNPGWPDRIAKAVGESVVVGGNLNPSFTFRAGININAINVPSRGMTTRDHEERHLRIDIQHWNNLAGSFVNSYEGTYGSRYCAKLVENMINAKLGMTIGDSLIAHAEFHRSIGASVTWGDPPQNVYLLGRSIKSENDKIFKANYNLFKKADCCKNDD